MSRRWPAQCPTRQTSTRRNSDAPNPDALSQALARNVWRGATPPEGAAAALARLARAQQKHLATQDADNLFAGEVNFLPQAQAAQ